MAMLMNDNLVRCINCGSALMVKENVCTYETTSKDENVYIEKPVYQCLKCLKCDMIVLRVGEDDDKKIIRNG